MRPPILHAISSLFGASDEQAMWRVRMQDDPDAFAQIVSRWQEPIRNLCTRMTGDLHRGEDLAQENFVRLYARRKEYQPQSKLSTYLWRIALNLCYDELRRAARLRETGLPSEESDTIIPLQESFSSTTDPSVALEAEERAAGVRQALLQLPEIYRTVLILRHYENLKFREIAEFLGLPEGTVKSRMVEGLGQLAEILGRRTDQEQSSTSKRASL